MYSLYTLRVVQLGLMYSLYTLPGMTPATVSTSVEEVYLLTTYSRAAVI